MNDESRRATLVARTLSVIAAAATLLAAGLDTVERIITVPSLPEGIFRERITVTEFREVPAPKPSVKTPEPLVEHVAEESDFQVDARPEPPPEPVPDPLPPEPEPRPEPPPPNTLPEPPAPEPESKPEPRPEPKPEPRPVQKPKPIQKARAAPKKPPIQKPQPAKAEPAEQPPSADAAGDASAGATGGAGGSSTAAGNASAGDESAALALIVREIEAKKRYPRRARQTGVEGRVVLAVSVNGEGVVTAVEVLEKHASVLLNRASLQAADGLAGMKLPLAKAMTVRVPVVFTLSDG